ncbi:hypothetical protein BSKO_01766 [Bryopsis sp. KO-2023]|nr:hypothetical protein BSKO_01766 [Bryopsis sp. KO-2023]
MEGIDEGFAKKLVEELRIERRGDVQTSSQGYVLALAAEKTSLETELIKARNEIAALQLENKDLKGKLKSANGTIIESEHTKHFQAENDRLRKQNRIAWQQVAELKEFLNDYGMVWVGSTEHDQDKDNRVQGSGHLETMNKLLPFSLKDFRQKVQELNQMAGDGCGKTNLFVYSDGVRLHDQKFLPYEDVAARALIKDIQDGFFPYLLKEDFPDGVLLELVDKSKESGGSSMHHRNHHQTPSNIHGMSDLDAPESPMGKTKFLKKLPQAIIKDGQVFNVRSEIAALLGSTGPVSEPVIIPSGIDSNLSQSQRMHPGPNVPNPSEKIDSSSTQDITTIRVKSEDGKITYIVKLRYIDTVGDLCKCVRQHLQQGGQDHAEFEVRSAFPPRCFDRMGESLQEAGLIPNATLFMRAKCS